MNRTAPRPQIEAFADRQALAEGVADAIAERLRQRLQESGERARLVASGGSTPVPAYELLRERQLDWSRVEVTLSDERWTPPSSPESNQGMLQAHLLTGPAADATLIPIWRPAHDPETAAALAEPEIAARLPFDVVLLGMGEDGHFASLFPGSPALEDGLDPDGGEICIAVPAGPPAPPQPRISLTLRALLDSELIILLIAGEAKKRTLEAAVFDEDMPVHALLLQDRTPVRILWAP